MTPLEADGFAQKAAAYVHIPFCSSVCPYCDFAVVAGRDDLIDRYVGALLREIRESGRWRPLDAVYFGGGTPSHVDAGLLGGVLGALEERHGIASGAEVSLEANPEDFGRTRAGELAAAGFNRVSFGAQSFDGVVLTALGRHHDAGAIGRSVDVAREAGFGSVSLDLIYGTPGETEGSWSNTVDRATALDPDHLSCYALTVERGTPLSRAIRDGAEAPDPDIQADRYEVAERLLATAGYSRYEVSNWAREGHECVYNLIVWAQGEYEAFGNGAHGYRSGRRFRNLRRLEAYIEAVEGGGGHRAGEDAIEGWDAELDRLFVGLRRTVGVGDGPGVAALLGSERGDSLVDAGVIRFRDGRLLIDRPLLTDEVHRSVLVMDPPQGWAEGASADNVSPSSDA